jgi:hypothetical protein
MTIYTHPDNVEELRKKLRPAVNNSTTGMALDWLDSLMGIDIVSDSHIEKDRTTGRYILPDNTVVEREDVCVEHRFFTYGPEDIWLLLLMGAIREERERSYYELNDNWNIRMDMFKMPMVVEPRFMLTSYC